MSEIKLKKDIRSRNQRQADKNRRLFRQAGLLALNILGSPGSGKTSLIEQTARHLTPTRKMLVIEGDVETERDADRIRALGIDAIQFQTHGACHLDAMMVAQCLQDLQLEKVELLIIENIGNLICPAGFDLGEDLRIVVGSTAEGADKPIKYPEMYLHADAGVINKTDLLPYVDFNPAEFEAGARRTNENLRLFRTSCTTGAGIDQWCRYLQDSLAKKWSAPT